MIFQAILERRLNRTTFGHGVDEVGDGMHERVFVADDMTGRPPLSNIWMHTVLLGDNDVSKPLPVGGGLAVEILQPIQILEIEFE